THSIDIDLPAPQPPTNVPPPKRDKNVLSVDSQGTITWNGTSLNESGLVYQLTESLKIKPEPELQFQPDAQAPYEETARVLRLIKGSGVTAFGFVGNEQYYQFGKDPKEAAVK
ncbi:MAG: ExbD/TolR family protein, partial [Novosphingobium sp.]